MSQTYLGTGWTFPVQLAPDHEIAVSEDEQDIRESIRIILGTASGERLMRPDFGCGIHQYVFEPNDTHTAERIRFQVQQALTRWEPRIDLQEVKVIADAKDQTVLYIEISYRIRSSDSRFNLVFPFYLERGEGA